MTINLMKVSMAEFYCDRCGVRTIAASHLRKDDIVMRYCQEPSCRKYTKHLVVMEFWRNA